MSWPAYSVQLLFSIFFFLPEQCSTRDPSRCQGRCGDAFSRGDNCHCDYSCLYFMECCHDYRKACTSEGSCKGRCYEDFKRGRECDCDLNCMTYGHCCPDYHLHCKAPPENQTYTLTSSTTTSPPAWRRVTTRKPPHKTSRNMIRDKIRPEDVTQVAQEHLLPSLSHDNGNKPPKQRQPWTPKKRMRKVIYEDDTSEGSKITTNRSPWTPRKKIKKVIYEDDTTEEPFEDPSPSATSSSSPGSKITTKRSPQTPRKKIKKVIYEDGTIEEPFEDPSPSSPGSKIATKRSPQTPKKKIKKVIYEDGTTEEPFEDPSPSSPGSKIATKRSPQTPKKKIKKVIYEDGTTEEPFEDPSPSSPGSKIATKRSPQTPKKKIKKVIYEDGTTEEPFEDPSPSSPGSKIATKRSPQTPKKKIKKVIYEDGTTEEPFEDPSPSSPGSKIATKRSPQTPKKKIKKVIYEDGTTEEPEDGLLPLVYPSVLSPPPTHGSNIPRSPPPWTPKKRIRKVIYDDDTTEEPFTDLSPTPSFSPKPPGSKITIKRSPKTPRKKRINEDGATEDPSQNPLSSQSTPLVLPLPSQSSRTPKKRSPKSPKMKPRAGIYPTDTTQDPIRGPSSTSPQSSTSSDVKVTTKRSPKTPNRKKAKKAESSEEIRETSENEFHKKSRSSSSSETSQRRSKSTLRRKSKKQEDDNLKRKKLPKENHKATTISPSLPEKSTSSKDVKPDEDGSGMDFSEDNTIPPPEPSTTESSTIGTEGIAETLLPKERFSKAPLSPQPNKFTTSFSTVTPPQDLFSEGNQTLKPLSAEVRSLGTSANWKTSQEVSSTLNPTTKQLSTSEKISSKSPTLAERFNIGRITTEPQVTKERVDISLNSTARSTTSLLKRDVHTTSMPKVSTLNDVTSNTSIDRVQESTTIPLHSSSGPTSEILFSSAKGTTGLASTTNIKDSSTESQTSPYSFASSEGSQATSVLNSMSSRSQRMISTENIEEPTSTTLISSWSQLDKDISTQKSTKEPKSLQTTVMSQQTSTFFTNNTEISTYVTNIPKKTNDPLDKGYNKNSSTSLSSDYVITSGITSTFTGSATSFAFTDITKGASRIKEKNTISSAFPQSTSNPTAPPGLADLKENTTETSLSTRESTRHFALPSTTSVTKQEASTDGTTGTKYVSKDPNSGDISTPVTILTPTTGQEESSWLGNQNRTTIQEFYRTFNPTKPKEYKNATMRSALPETTTSLTTRPQQNRTTTSAPKLSSIHTTFNSITTDGNSTQRKSDSSHTTKSNPKDRPRNNSLVTSKSVDKGYLEETYTTHPAPVNNTRMPTVKGERTTSKGKRHQKKTATEPAEPMNQRTNSVLNPMKTTVSISTQNSFMLPEESTTMPSLQLIKDRRTTYQTPQTYFTPVSTIRSKTRLPKQTDSTPLRQNKTAKVPLPKDEKNLCKGTPADGMTVLQNGSLVVFRDHYFWNLNPFGIVTENPRRISDVWGVPSPIDTVFTRCNCDGKTFFFKGSHYWRFTNDIMDAGYPKQIVKGFGGLKEKVTAVLSVAAYKTRPESVYFFRSGLVQKYTYRQEPARKCSGGNHPIIQYPVYTYSNQPRKRQFEHKIVQYTRKARHLYADGSNNNGARTGILHEEIPIRSYWRGFPNSIVSAVSLPNPQKPDGYDYFVFSKEQYYNVNMSSRIAMKASPKKQQRTTKDWYKCTD
uniref:Proteoglycan 4 isoform X2 n=1 Tax=Geotrypetes seraphini TaxID=260995 RepID=A0A6P8SQL3_GEOSA|nr:proteoglycan 4 isoform X2 [Geotrypetes seraphini]